MRQAPLAMKNHKHHQHHHIGIMLVGMSPVQHPQTSLLLSLRITGGTGLEVSPTLCQLYPTPANRLMMDRPRKEKSSFLNPSCAGLLSVGSQFRMYNFESFSNVGSSFNDHNMLRYIGYVISCSIIFYSVMFCHDMLKRIPLEITWLSLQITTCTNTT